MANVVIMPRQGQSVESCIITTWQKKKGDRVETGDILFSYETDKSAFDEPAQVSGTVLEVLAAEGDVIPCLDPVCIIGEPGEDISALLPKKRRKKSPPRPKPKPPFPNPTVNGSSSLPAPVTSPSTPERI